MRGLYDYRGECFGYIDGDKVYDLNGRHSGYYTPQAINDLQQQRVWSIDRSGLYNEHWECIGYISADREGQNDDR